MAEAILKITNCMDCPHHLVMPDPDPEDWFCDDDVKVVCTNMSNHEPITTACRPHHKRQECSVPKWCPLIKSV